MSSATMLEKLEGLIGYPEQWRETPTHSRVCINGDHREQKQVITMTECLDKETRFCIISGSHYKTV